MATLALAYTAPRLLASERRSSVKDDLKKILGDLHDKYMRMQREGLIYEYVIFCDETNNGLDALARGELNVDIFYKPVQKPYVHLSFIQRVPLAELGA